MKKRNNRMNYTFTFWFVLKRRCLLERETFVE